MTLWPYVFVCYSSMFHVACTDDRDVFHFHCTGALKHHQLMCAIHGSVAIWIDQFFLVVASLAMTHHDKTLEHFGLEAQGGHRCGCGSDGQEIWRGASVCQSCGHVRCRAKEDSHNVCALAHTESTVLEDTELFKL